MKISIIVPVYNESHRLHALLEKLKLALAHGHQIIVADGGSSDGGCADLPAGVEVIQADKGRAAQMNGAAGHALGDVLWFVHADSSFPEPLENYLQTLTQVGESQWGRFNVRLSGASVIYRIIGLMMNLRSRLTGISTGDQGLFIHKNLFDTIGGYSDIAIMEDIEICKRLKKHSSPIIATTHLQTSSRRWQEKGIVRTILLMWTMRFLYFIGVDTATLARMYER